MTASNQSQTAFSTDSQQPLVSVIIPAYNRPAYLKEALESAVGQNYQNIEIIVSDDCSRENLQAVVDDFQDPRIIFMRNETNFGMVRNIGNIYKKAQGKYVAHLNDDDMWNKDFLEKLVPPLERHPDLALAFCDHYLIDADGEINYPETEKCTQVTHRRDLKEGVYQPFCKLAIVEHAVASPCAAVIRKDAFDWDDIPVEIGGYWDVYINYLCCRSGRGAYYYPERLTRYRAHSQSYTRSNTKKDVEINIRKAEHVILLNERLMEDERLEELKPFFKKEWAIGMRSLGVNLLRAKKVADARPYLLSSLTQHPNLKTLVALILSFTPHSLASRF